ncbi:alpha/beta hydrolase [Xylariaceae sp. FL0255]|nr:alpha/beta hydrolase [Xylariaceae sp. FL0255]
MVITTEGTFSVDGVTLFTKTWLPEGQLKAKVIMIHGFNDHIDRYFDFFPYLAERGIAVYGFDQRGWGKSVKTSSERGKTGPTTRVLADMAAFIRQQLPSEVPVFVLGHSMGGGQALTLASSPGYEDLIRQIRGWILESPFIGFSPELKPNWFTVASGRLASHIVPNMHMYNHIPPEDVVKSPEVQESIRTDPLLHSTGTLEGLASMLDRTNALSGGKIALSKNVKSLYLMHGQFDKTTSHEESKKWFGRQLIPDGKFQSYDDRFAHQLHADADREEFFRDTADWILERCEDGDKTTAGESAAPAAESKL